MPNTPSALGTATPSALALSTGTTPLLRVHNLSKHYPTKGSPTPFKAIDNLTFSVQRGQTLGIVGESGSGKTTAARCILRALDPTSGSALFQSKSGEVDLATLSPRQLKPLRKEMQMIFQDPFSSLNPRMTAGDIIAEPLVIHRIGTRREQREKVVEMLRRVGLLPEHRSRYPHAFSGGQRQRIGIARALILKPALVVADESVSALDVSVRAKILDLLRELQLELNLTYLFVAHDLSVVRSFCDRVLVMYRGQIMEQGDTKAIFATPRHAYTKVLLSAIPFPDPARPMNPLSTADLTSEELLPLTSPTV